MMKKLSQIAKLFRGSERDDDKGALSVSFDDLMEQRRNIRYLHIKTKLDSSMQAGNVKSAFKGRGIEMEEIREYTPGDDVRDIDWRVTARKKTPYTKVYAEEKDHEVYVVLDLSASMAFGTKKELKSVTACKAAALLGWMAQENNDRFGAFIFDGRQTWRFKPQQNRAQLLAIFKKISVVSKNILENKFKSSGMEKTLQLLIKGLKGRASVFIISDFANWGDENNKLLAAISHKAQVFCIDIYDILEAKAPLPGEYMIADDGENLVFDTHSKAFCEEYSRFFEDRRSVMNDFCRKCHCKWIEVRTDIALTKQLKII